MTFEEARAQFPVLERLAYLNAGTFGPIARTTHEAISAELERDYRDGRSGGPNFARVMELRDQLRERIAALVGAEPLQVALTTSTTDGCNIVLGGLGLGPEDEIVTTTDEHFGLLGALATSGAQGRRRRARAGCDPRRRHAPDAAARALAGDLDDGPDPARARAPGGDRHSRARRRCPVRGRDPRRRGRIRLPHDLRPEVALRAGLDRGPRRRRPGRPERLGTELLLAGRVRAGRAVRAEARRGPLRHRLVARRRRSRACWRRSTAARPGPSIMPPPSPSAAASSSPSAGVEVVSPAEGERSTLVAFRPAGEPAEIVEALYDAGVHVREIPNAGLDPRVLRLVDLGRRSRSPARRRCPNDRARAPVPAALSASRSTARSAT